MNTISDRALEFAKHKGYNAAEFERIAGLSNGMTRNLCEKTRKSTFDRISNAFPELNINWLRTGSGEMLLDNNTVNANDMRVGDRFICDVSHGSAATLGNQSPVYKDVKIGKDDCANQEVEELRKLLAEAQNRISNLEGRIEEKESFIQKLLAR